MAMNKLIQASLIAVVFGVSSTAIRGGSGNLNNTYK